MTFAATDLTGWWVGYAIGVPVIAVVACLLIVITLTVRRIAAVAADATDSLLRTRERTEVLWELEKTTETIREIRDEAAHARGAWGGGR